VGGRHPDNRLHGESSVYLRQHAENPVAWWPWGAEPFAEAKRRRCPVLVSVGYASCHWCHVMERECFEDDQIAELMNRELVCIKVDREERPDVDQIYMDALMRLTGRGGWPLNVFCLPDGRPFFGGTYFPPDRSPKRPSWPDVIQAIARICREQPDRVQEQAGQVLGVLESWPELEPVDRHQRGDLVALCEHAMREADVQHGGFGPAPKFPMPPRLEALLAASAPGIQRSDAAIVADTFAHVCFTLVCMARGGVYDQLGGGFHRYSTDPHWAVPHFEKMLYDNGQLLRVYAEAYRQSRDPALEWPVAETIDYLEREMCGPSTGFYASQDADSEGEEGRYYVWDPAQVAQVLDPPAAERFADAFGVTARGNFEGSGKSVLQQLTTEARDSFRESIAKLRDARSERVAPVTDRKCIAAWNGYAIAGIATAAATWQRADWLELAEQIADFVWTRMGEQQGELMRVWTPDATSEAARIPAFLDDYAALLTARLDLHRASGAERHVKAALRLAERICELFYSPERRDLFYVRDGDASLIYRPRTDSDGAMPSASGLAVVGLIRVGHLSGRRVLLEVARAVLERHAPLMQRSPTALPSLLRADALDAGHFGLGLIIGDRSDPRTRELADRARELLSCDEAVVVVEPGERPDWLDPAWLEGRSSVEVPTAFVCRGNSCSAPATCAAELAVP